MRFLRSLALLCCTLLAVQASQAVVPQADLLSALKSGGHVLLLRHAQTTPGVGDPPNFKLDDCGTQRNLSDEGRAQAKRIGEALRTSGIRFARTLTSQWCRCRDTATLISDAADRVEAFPALNSFFDNRMDEPKQTAAVKAKAKTLRRSETWLLVTHQVNITSLTGVVPSMGEGVVVRVRNGEWKTIGVLAL
jgi:phosphohistidine phosphatase SixA